MTDNLKSLLLRDLTAMAVQVACVIQDQNSQKALLDLQKNSVQAFLDLLHAVYTVSMFPYPNLHLVF
jgi:hypothetical protein